MTTDRELLGLAAKASGYTIHEYETHGAWVIHQALGTNIYGEPIHFYWAPMSSDSDALRLAVTLRLGVHYESQTIPGGGRVEIVEIFHSHNEDTGACRCQMQELGNNPHDATRRAIVMAAAEIGRNMP